MSKSEFERTPGFPMAFRAAGKRIRVTIVGVTIVDTDRAMVMDEDAHVPVYYFPRDAVRMDLMTRTTHSSH
jgi:adenylate cyclase